MPNYKDSLEKEIETRLEGLKEMDVKSEEYGDAVGSLSKLMDRAIELEKLENERTDKQVSHREEKKDRFARHAIDIAGIAIPTAVTIWGFIKSIEFEKEGTITTIFGRGFANKLLPRK